MKKGAAIIGLGYVGLTMVVCIAEKGIETIGVEVNKEKISSLNQGKSPIYEPSLEEMLKRNIKEGRLSFCDDYSSALKDSDIIFITVGTPSKPDGSLNTEQIESASISIGKALANIKGYHLVVMRSTAIPGTARKIITSSIETNSGKNHNTDFGICVNPEFLREGTAVKDMLEPERMIIGEGDEKAGNLLEEFYNRLYAENPPHVLRTSLENAEMIKYANNALLATKVSFINSIANLCEKIPEGDVEVVAKAIGLDPRISPLFLKSGLGWGGSCFPKDLRAILSFAREVNVDLPIVEATIKVNELQYMLTIERLRELLNGLKGRCVSILGLAFKPNTDDVRDAVSLRIIHKLLQEGAHVRAYDPVATENSKKILGERIFYANSAKECIEGADCCIIVTEWDEFKRLKPEDFMNRMSRPILIDGRRIYDPDQFSKKLEYFAIGLRINSS